VKSNFYPMKFRLLLGLSAGLLGSWAARAQNPAPVVPPPPPAEAPASTTPPGKVKPPPVAIDVANEPIVKVIGNVMPAVVNITAEGTVPQYYNSYGQFFRRYTPEQSIGSGLIISADGFVLTNAHVVSLAEQEKVVSITLKSGSKYQAKIIYADEDADLALLKIQDNTVVFPYFDLNYVSPNLLGETVVAMGSPAGYQSSASHGILSAKGRMFTVENHTYNNLLQTDAAINPGNSGGPLVDLNGSLVGINSAKLAGPAIENIGFAIPHEVVVPWATDAMAVARGQKPAAVSRAASLLDVVKQRLGLELKTLTEAKAAEMDINGGGLIITNVEDSSPAADENLRKNMVVVAIGNHQVTDENTLPGELKGLHAGDKVRMQVVYVQPIAPGLGLQRGSSVVMTAR
jgi:serine protease Do